MAHNLLTGLRYNFVLFNNQMVKASVEGRGAFVLANQLIFFTLCDCLFRQPRVTSLYCLLFYNVTSYLVSYISELFGSNGYTPYVFISEQTNVRHLAMTATKVVLDLTRAVTFVITGVAMLLLFGVHQGLDEFSPCWPYVAVTVSYYLLTEPCLRDHLCSAVVSLHLDVFESLENLWTPVIVYFSTTSVSSLLLLSVLPWLVHGTSLLMVAIYTNIYIGAEATRYYWNRLTLEMSSLEKYRYASRSELKSCDDVCAVCLHRMAIARVTPCHHLFHSDCLRLCIRRQNNCPMCKRQL